MTFLGAFDVGDLIQLQVVWTPAPGEPDTTGTTAILTSQSGEVVGPLAADNAALNTWTVTFTPTSGGRWSVRWESIPPGGVEHAWLYAQV